MAGRVASSYTGKTVARWEKADGAGPVTQADLSANRILQSSLCLARPDYGWLSEETEDDDTRLTKDRVFIVDPIDGTRSFVEGARTWAIAVAVAEAGRITAGAVYLPMRDKLFAAAEGAGTTLNGQPLQVSPCCEEHGARVLAAKPNFADDNWPGGVPDVDRHYRPSLAYRLSLVGSGDFDAMLTLRPSWEWDIAAGSILITEAGGHISDRTGQALRFNNEKPLLNGIVAGPKPLHDKLLAKLKTPAG